MQENLPNGFASHARCQRHRVGLQCLGTARLAVGPDLSKARRPQRPLAAWAPFLVIAEVARCGRPTPGLSARNSASFIGNSTARVRTSAPSPPHCRVCSRTHAGATSARVGATSSGCSIHVRHPKDLLNPGAFLAHSLRPRFDFAEVTLRVVHPPQVVPCGLSSRRQEPLSLASETGARSCALGIAGRSRTSVDRR